MAGEEDKNNFSITHGVIVPLAGGFALGATNIINKPPEVIFSFKEFENNDKLYLRYLKQQGIEVPYYQLNSLDAHQIRFLSKKYNYVDFFTGILPCSGLSQAAKRDKGSRGDCKVNDWMYKSAEFALCCLKPKVFAFENAPTLFTSIGEPVRNKLIRIAQKHGYSITFYKTNTIKHGIPQYRPRTFVLLVKNNVAPILSYYDRHMPLLADYLKQIPEHASHQDIYMNDEYDITNYEITRFFKKIYGNNWRNIIYENYNTHLTSYDYLKRENLLYNFREFVNTLPDASSIVKRDVDHVIKKTELGMNFRLSYRVLGMDRDYTYAVISEMMHRTIHPVEDRLLNIREHMHLMGLPHNYELEDPKEFSKITQNVPTNTCSDITAEIVKVINGNSNSSKSVVHMQDNTKEIELIKTKSLF